MRQLQGTSLCMSIFFLVTSFAIMIVVVTTNASKGSSSTWSWSTGGIASLSSPSFSNFSFTDDKSQDGARNKSGLRRSKKKRDEKLGRVEAGLARARALIRDAMINQNSSSPLYGDSNYVPEGDVYRNAYAFRRSYQLMERMFRIYIYEEGEPPLFHTGPCKDIYSTEGIFINLMETNTRFRTRDPDRAHVYYLPFSVVMILDTLFDPIFRDKAVLERIIGGYIQGRP